MHKLYIKPTKINQEEIRTFAIIKKIQNPKIATDAVRVVFGLPSTDSKCFEFVERLDCGGIWLRSIG